MPDPVPPRHTLRNACLGLVAVLVLSIGLWMSVPPSPPADASPGTPPVPPADSLPVVAGVGGDFRLASTRGGAIALSGLRGRIVLLNFGYTQCPDVCPMTLSRLGRVLREMDRQGLEVSRVVPLFITFDPARDSLDVLRDYVAFFHPALIGLRGDEAQTAALATSYKVIHVQQDTGSAGGYVFQHSSFVYVIDAFGRVRLLVDDKDPDAALVEAVRRLLREATEVER